MTLLGWLLIGCSYGVVVASSPPGASVYLDDVVAGVTPLQGEVRNRRRRPAVRVELTGYRSFEVDMRSDLGPVDRLRYNLRHPWIVLGTRPPPTRTLVLIPEHGPAGTWTPEDVER